MNNTQKELDESFQEITNKEQYRTYIYPTGQVTILNAARLSVRRSGNHRVETESGEKYIVMAGWLAIKIGAEAWSF